MHGAITLQHNGWNANVLWGSGCNCHEGLNGGNGTSRLLCLFSHFDRIFYSLLRLPRPLFDWKEDDDEMMKRTLPPSRCISDHIIVTVNQCQSAAVLPVKAVGLVLVYWMRSNILVMTHLKRGDYETDMSVWCVFVCVSQVTSGTTGIGVSNFMVKKTPKKATYCKESS